MTRYQSIWIKLGFALLFVVADLIVCGQPTKEKIVVVKNGLTINNSQLQTVVNNPFGDVNIQYYDPAEIIDSVTKEVVGKLKPYFDQQIGALSKKVKQNDKTIEQLLEDGKRKDDILKVTLNKLEHRLDSIGELVDSLTQYNPSLAQSVQKDLQYARDQIKVTQNLEELIPLLTYLNENGELSIGYSLADIESSPYFGYIGEFDQGVAKIRVQNKYGYIDTSGAMVIPIEYDSLSEINSGLITAIKEGEYFYLRPDGSVALEGFLHVDPFFKGSAVVQRLDGDYCIIDSTGKQISESYYYINPFDDCPSTQYFTKHPKIDFFKEGLIDTKGEILLKAKNCRLAKVEGKPRYILDNFKYKRMIDWKGEDMVFPKKLRKRIDFFFNPETDGFIEYWDRKDFDSKLLKFFGGEWRPSIYNPYYVDTLDLSEVDTNFTNIKWKYKVSYPTIEKPKFKESKGIEIYDFEMDMYRKSMRTFFMDDWGWVMSYADFNEINAKYNYDGSIKVRRGEDSWGLVDNKLHRLTPIAYHDVKPMQGGFYEVQNDEGLWGFIDTNGKQIVDFEYAQTAGFLQGTAMVAKKVDADVGAINSSGREIIPPCFYGIRRFDSGFIVNDSRSEMRVSDEGNCISNCQLYYQMVKDYFKRSK